MPIKSLKISFNLPLPQLLAFIQASGADMQIDVYGTEPKKPRKALAAPDGVALLEAPRKKRRRTTDVDAFKNSRSMVLLFIAAAKGKNVERAKITHVLDGTEYAPSSVTGIISVLQKRSLIDRVSPGVYRATPTGLLEAHRLMKLKNAATKVDAHGS